MFKYMYYSGVQKVKEKYYLKVNTSSDNKILMFHQVNDDEDTWLDANCAIKETTFSLLINKLSIKSLQDIFYSKHFVALTFDDGYLCIYDTIYPILKKRNLPFTIFITYSFINRSGYITDSMLQELAREPLCTIGSHSITHPILRFCSKQQALYEIKNSKVLIEDKIGKKVDYFAYPYGSIYACSERDKKIAEQAGYKYSFSTLKSTVNQYEKNKFFIPRINICESNYKSILKVGKEDVELQD